MQGTLETAGERIRLDVAIGWIADLVEETAGSSLVRTDDGDATMRVVVERDRRPFPGGMIGRGLRRSGRDVVIEDAAQTGFDMLVRPWDTPPTFVLRWRPTPQMRMLRAAAPARWRLRVGTALTQYPAIWRAITVARAPLHAACFAIEQGTALVVGAPGSGKSSALTAEGSPDLLPVTDNLCVADPRTVWPVVEPFRVDAAAAGDEETGLPTTRGRVAISSRRRRTVASPDLVVVLERGDVTRVRDADPSQTARLMVTATYACGELRRFWPFAATLAMATGCGPALPPVLPVARALVDRLPCVGISLARPGLRISDVLTSRDAHPAPTPVSSPLEVSR